MLDCPPSISLESVLHAADILLVPLIPTTLSVRTLGQLSVARTVIPALSLIERMSLERALQVCLFRRVGGMMPWYGHIPASSGSRLYFHVSSRLPPPGCWASLTRWPSGPTLTPERQMVGTRKGC